MKKWQKSWLILLASSLAIGWIAQGEAAVIRIGGSGMVISQAQPVQVIIFDSNGNTYEQTAYFDPSSEGINIDTSWAGPGASIYIPSLGLGYLWYNGFWVDQEGYYWNGPRRVYIADPQWKEHWRHYWHKHRHNDERGGWGHGGWRDSGDYRVEGLKDGGGSWGHEGWHNRGENWRGDRDDNRGDKWRGDRGDNRGDNWPGSWGANRGEGGASRRGGWAGRGEDNESWRGDQGRTPDMMPSRGYEGGPSSPMGTGGYQGRQSPGGMQSPGAMQSGSAQGGRSSGNPRTGG